MSESYHFDGPTRFGVGAEGEPGSRLFYLQAQGDGVAHQAEHRAEQGQRQAQQPQRQGVVEQPEVGDREVGRDQQHRGGHHQGQQHHAEDPLAQHGFEP